MERENHGERIFASRSVSSDSTSGWEKQETAAGIPFYVNHNMAITQWDHPRLVSVMEECSRLGYIRYAAYRMAAKLVLLQKALQLSSVSLSSLEAALEKNRLHGYGAHDLLLDVGSMTSVLRHMFDESHAPDYDDADIGVAVDLTTNLILNLYDPQRRGHVTVLHLKICLFVLCSGRLCDKLKYISNELQDGKHRITHEKLTTFLHNISKIPEILGEETFFGSDFVYSAALSCRKLTRFNYVPEKTFLHWLMRQPQNLVWLSTFYRLRSSENVIHLVKCSTCKVSPIAGLRYQCMECLNFNQCQQCFFGGIPYKGHSVKHRMQEHCQPTTQWEKMRSVLTTLKHKMHRWKSEPKPCFLPLQPIPQEAGYIRSLESRSLPQSPKMGVRAAVLQHQCNGGLPCCNEYELQHGAEGTALNTFELENIIRRLERESEEVMQAAQETRSLCSVPAADGSPTLRQKHLQRHLVEIDAQLKRLRHTLHKLMTDPDAAASLSATLEHRTTPIDENSSIGSSDYVVLSRLNNFPPTSSDHYSFPPPPSLATPLIATTPRRPNQLNGLMPTPYESTPNGAVVTSGGGGHVTGSARNFEHFLQIHNGLKAFEGGTPNDIGQSLPSSPRVFEGRTSSFSTPPQTPTLPPTSTLPPSTSNRAPPPPNSVLPPNITPTLPPSSTSNTLPLTFTPTLPPPNRVVSSTSGMATNSDSGNASQSSPSANGSVMYESVGSELDKVLKQLEVLLEPNN